jgi:hypothetical protein
MNEESDWHIGTSEPIVETTLSPTPSLWDSSLYSSMPKNSNSNFPSLATDTLVRVPRYVQYRTYYLSVFSFLT